MSVGFITYNAAFGIGPERDLGNEYVLVSGMGAAIAQLLRSDGHQVVTADEVGDEPALDDGPLSSATVLSVPSVQGGLSKLGCDALVPFKNSPRLEQLASELGLRVLAAPARLVRQLENKLALPELAAAAGARIPATEVVRLDPGLVERARSGRLGLPRIFQPAVGFAGAGTRTLRSPDDVAALVASAKGGAVGKLTEPIVGDPVTVNGVVIDDGVVLAGAVARQLTGIAGLTASEFGSCGNEWSLPLHPEVDVAVRKLALHVGSAIAGRGFRGIFGIDAVLTGDGPVLIELNPRCTASLSLQVQLQQHGGGPTLFDAHLLAFDHPAARAGVGALLDAFGAAAQPQVDAAAANVILFQRGDEPVVPRPLAPGIYSVTAAGSLRHLRDGYRYDQLADVDELLVLPQSHRRAVAPGAELARVTFRRRVAAGTDARILLPDATAAMAAVRRALIGDHPLGRLPHAR